MLCSLTLKPDFDKTIARFEVWWLGEVLDRPPVTIHVAPIRPYAGPVKQHAIPRDRWLDVEFRVDQAIAEMQRRVYLGDSFPIFWPNVGPEISAAPFGCELEWGEHTHWSRPIIHLPEDWLRVPAMLTTLAGARDRVRQLKAKGLPDGGVTILLKGGAYPLAEPILFTPADSGTAAAPIFYSAAPGEKPLLTGGRAITGWRKHNDTIWVADVPDVKAGAWSFNQFYINGQLRRRARFPNEGFCRVAGFPDGGKEVHYHTDCQRFEYAEGDINPNWKNLDDVNVIVYHFWTDSHLPIQSIDTQKRIVTFKHKAGKVFYIPQAGEDLAKAEVAAPFAPAFIVFQGDAKQHQFVENISFRGLSFMYSRFELPPGNSNDSQGSATTARSTPRPSASC